MKTVQQQLRQHILQQGIDQGATLRFSAAGVSWKRMDASMLSELDQWPLTPASKNGCGNFDWEKILNRYDRSSKVFPYVVTYQGQIEMAAMLKISSNLDRVSLRFVERRLDGSMLFKGNAAGSAIDACLAAALASKDLFQRQGIEKLVQVAVHDAARELEPFYFDLGKALPGGKYKFKNEKTLLLGWV